MKTKLSLFVIVSFSFFLSSCVEDVDSVPPRNVTLLYNWEAANIAGLDSGFIRISHQAGAAEFVLKPIKSESIITGVIGNLIVHETPDIQEEGTAVVDQTYIIPIGQDSAEIIFIAAEFL